MIKPTVIIPWPVHVDYPICRYNLKRFKDYFSEIIIPFSIHHVNKDYTEFIKNDIPFCTFTTPPVTNNHWYQNLIYDSIERSKTEYILFMEQDFLIKDNTFLEKVFTQDNDAICAYSGERPHQEFALVKKDVINKTSKDFTERAGGWDCFGLFFQEIQKITNLKNVEEFEVHNKEDYYHMGGLTQNYRNFEYDDPFYNPVNFLYFNWKSLQLPNQHPEFLNLEQQIENKFGHAKHHTFLDNFFPEL